MAVPLSAEDRVRVQRCIEYARSTVVLEEDHEVPGAAAIYELALCNGLAVIVAAHWPGSEVKGNGQVKSAKVLLEAIVSEEAKVGHTGDVLILDQPPSTQPITFPISTLWGDSVEPDPGARVEVAVFREALTLTAPRRHGNLSQKTLQRKHIDALVALDAHPQLGVLVGEHGDRYSAKERVRDLWRRGQAEEYLELLGEEEIERRVRRADDLLPFDPKDRASSLGLWDCPVCDQEALLATHLDDFGAGVATGRCFVCGYYRSPSIADDEAIRFMWVNKWMHE